jgi:hypothetical protein
MSVLQLSRNSMDSAQSDITREDSDRIVEAFPPIIPIFPAHLTVATATPGVEIHGFDSDSVLNFCPIQTPYFLRLFNVLLGLTFQFLEHSKSFRLLVFRLGVKCGSGQFAMS